MKQATRQSQSLRQTQSLSPRLQQAVRLLALTRTEMTTAIAREMEENPLLEAAGEAAGDERLVLEGHGGPAPAGPAGGDPGRERGYEETVSRGETLAERLLGQFRMLRAGDQERRAAFLIIHSLDGDGYLAVPFEEIVRESGAGPDACARARAMVKGLDPAGCGSEGLVDCLLTQARALPDRDPLLETVIRDHLGLVESGGPGAVADAAGADVEAVRRSLRRLRSLHPKPGRLVSPEPTHYVVPDITAVPSGDGLVARVNDDGVPLLRISPIYKRLLRDGSGATPEEREFVLKKARDARWLIKAVLNRRRTIQRVADAILDRQRDFFRRGGRGRRRPMALKDIAEETGVHESTVSRATTNKYIHTPVGVFELRSLFERGVGDRGREVSPDSLKGKIAGLCGHEDPRRPLSDQRIADLLSHDDLKVSRRTVSKYREELGIPASAARKNHGIQNRDMQNHDMENRGAENRGAENHGIRRKP